MYLLARYFTERLLYRLSASKYNTNFILKGGSLLYAIGGLDSRSTVDIDFTANKIDRENGNIEKVINEQLKSIVDDYWKSCAQENPG